MSTVLWRAATAVVAPCANYRIVPGADREPLKTHVRLLFEYTCDCWHALFIIFPNKQRYRVSRFFPLFQPQAFWASGAGGSAWENLTFLIKTARQISSFFLFFFQLLGQIVQEEVFMAAQHWQFPPFYNPSEQLSWNFHPRVWVNMSRFEASTGASQVLAAFGRGAGWIMMGHGDAGFNTWSVNSHRALEWFRLHQMLAASGGSKRDMWVLSPSPIPKTCFFPCQWWHFLSDLSGASISSYRLLHFSDRDDPVGPKPRPQRCEPANAGPIFCWMSDTDWKRLQKGMAQSKEKEC